MDLGAIFSDIAIGISAQFGGPYHAASIHRTTFTRISGGDMLPAETQIPCRVQIDRVTEAMRSNPAFSDAEVAILVLRASFTGNLTTDDRIVAEAGEFEGVVWKLTAPIDRDAMGIYLQAGGVRDASAAASPSPISLHGAIVGSSLLTGALSQSSSADTGGVAISTAVTLNSSTGAYTFTITRTGDTSGPKTATVSTGPSATPGVTPATVVDFGGAFPSATVSWAAGQTAAKTATFTPVSNVEPE